MFVVLIRRANKYCSEPTPHQAQAMELEGRRAARRRMDMARSVYRNDIRCAGFSDAIYREGASQAPPKVANRYKNHIHQTMAQRVNGSCQRYRTDSNLRAGGVFIVFTSSRALEQVACKRCKKHSRAGNVVAAMAARRAVRRALKPSPF
jgi:hypothetical protein